MQAVRTILSKAERLFSEVCPEARGIFPAVSKAANLPGMSIEELTLFSLGRAAVAPRSWTAFFMANKLSFLIYFSGSPEDTARTFAEIKDRARRSNVPDQFVSDTALFEAFYTILADEERAPVYECICRYFFDIVSQAVYLANRQDEVAKRSIA